MNPFASGKTRASTFLIAIKLLASIALATDGTWSATTGDFLWGNSANWNAGSIADAQNGIATFPSLADITVHLNSARTIGQLSFSTNNWGIDNNATPANVLTLSTSSGTPSIAVASGTTTISATLAGTQGFTKTGAGTLAVLGAYNTTGALVLDGGTLNFNATNTPSINGALRFGPTAGSTNYSTVNINQSLTTSSLVVQTSQTYALINQTNATPAGGNTISIASGKTLTVNGPITVGLTTTSSNQSIVVRASGFGSLVAGAAGQILTVGPANTSTSTAGSAYLDLSGLSNFSYTGSAVQVGGSLTTGQLATGVLALANTSNTIRVATFIDGGSTTTGTGGTFSRVDLGAGTNDIGADNIYIGNSRLGGVFGWQSGVTTGTLNIHSSTSTAEAPARVANIIVGSTSAFSTTTINLGGPGNLGYVNLNGHSVNILATNILLGQKNLNTATSGNRPTNATLSFDQGTIDTMSLVMAQRFNANATNTQTGPVNTYLNIGGGSLTVGSGGITLADDQSPAIATGYTQTTHVVSVLNAKGGTLTTNNDIKLGASTANDGISASAELWLAGGTVDLTGHNIGSFGFPIRITGNSGGANPSFDATTGVPIAVANGNMSGTLRNVGQVFTTDGGNPNGIIKGGSGALTFDGTNTYTGDTTINGGTVIVSGTLNSSGTVTVNGGGVLSGTGTDLAHGRAGLVTLNTLNLDGSNNTITSTSSGISPGATAAIGQYGKLTMSQLDVGGSGGYLKFDLTDPASANNDSIVVTGAANFNSALHIVLPTVPAGSATPYTIITAGSITGSGPFVVEAPSGTRTTFSTPVVASNKLQFTVTGNAKILTWTGANGNTWDVNATTNWSDSGSTTVANEKYFNLDTVNFKDKASDQSITISATVQPSAVLVDNSTATLYTFTGADITGASTTLTKSNTGKVILANNNTYDGITTVSGGTLQLGNAGTTGSVGAADVALNATTANLAFNRTDGTAATPLVVSNNITGTGNVQQNGTGVVLLAGANTYSGATTVASGATLQPTTASSLGITTGTVGSEVTIASGATLDLQNLTATGTNVTTASFGTKKFIISGTGVGGTAGAIAHSGLNAATNIFHSVELAADATIVTDQRINIGDASLSGTLNLAGHTLTKDGTNNLYLNNTSVTDGNIVVESGRLQLEGTTQILAGSSTGIQLNANSTLGLNATLAGNITRPININGTATIGPQTNTAARVDSPITLNDTVTEMAINTNGTGTLTLSGNISGSGIIAKDVNSNGTDTLVLSGNNSFGGLTIKQGTVRMGSATALSSTTALLLDTGGNLAPTLQMNGFGVTAGDLNSSNFGAVIENASANAATLTVTSSGTNTYVGMLRDGTGGGKLSLNAAGTGTLTLDSGSSLSYTGSTTVSGGGTLVLGSPLYSSTTLNVQNGTLKLNGTSLLPVGVPYSDLTLGSGSTSGVFDLGGNSDVQLATLATSGAGSGNIVGSSGSGPVTLKLIGGSGTAFAGRIQNTVPAGGTGVLSLVVGDDSTTTSLVLTGVNTFTGATEIKYHATLTVGVGGVGSLSSSGTVHVNNGATLTGSGSMGAVTLESGGTILPGNSPGVITMSGLTMNGGDIRYELPVNDAGGTHDKVVVNGTAILNGGQLTPLNPGAIGTGLHTLMHYSGGHVGNSVTLNVPNDTRANFQFTIGDNDITINPTATTLSLTWVGGASGDVGNWNAGTSSPQNWSNNGTQIANDKFFNLDTVNFTDASSNKNVHINNSAVLPGTVNVTNSSGIYTFDGNSIDGDTALNKSGAGTLFLNMNNNYTGGTTLSSGGSIQLGDGSNSGSLGSGAVTGTGVGGTLSLNSPSTSVNGVISGPIAVQQVSSGNSTLNAVNTYSGATEVRNGILQIGPNGSIMGTALTLGNGANSGILELQGSSTATVTSLSVSGAGTTNAIQGSGTLIYAGSAGSYSGLFQNGVNLNVTIGSLTLTGNSTTNGSVTIGAGTTLQVGNGSTTGSINGPFTNNGTLVINRSDDTSLGQQISGIGTLTKLGAGKLTITAQSDYTGNTVISSGTVVVGAVTNGTNSVFGSTATGSVTVASGATLDLSTGTTDITNGKTFGTKLFIIAGSGVGGIGAIHYAGIDLNGNPNQVSTIHNLQLSAEATINTESAVFGSTDGRIDIRAGTQFLDLQGHTLTKIGLGQLSFFAGGAITASGGTIDVQQGTFSFNNNPTVDTNGLLKVGSTSLAGGSAQSRVALNGSTIAIPIQVHDFARLLDSSVSSTVNSPITFTNAGNLAIESSSTANLTMTLGGSISGPGSITLFSNMSNIAGTPTNFVAAVNGNNSYSGGTTITAGTLRVGHDNALGSSSARLTMNGTTANAVGAGILDLNGHSITVGAFGGASTGNDLGIVTSGVAGAVTFSFGSSAAQTAPFAGIIQDGNGAVSIAKNGSDTVTLSGVNTYTGNTTVNGGTLVLGVADGIGNTSRVILNGGTLSSGGFSQNMNSAPLKLTANSTIDMGASQSNPNVVHLADSSDTGTNPWTAGAVLRISNWVGNAAIGGGTDQITLSGTGLTAGELAQVHFTSYRDGAKLISGELAPLNAMPRLWRGDLDGSDKSNPTPAIPTNSDLSKLLQVLTDLTAYQNNTIGGGNGFASMLSYAELLDVADVNNDGTIDNGDMQAEIYAIITGTAPSPPAAGALPGAGPVPEPTSIVLLTLGSFAGLAVRVRNRRGRALMTVAEPTQRVVEKV